MHPLPILVLLLLAAAATAETWRPVPLVSAEQRAAGRAGGEGGQWVRAIVVDGTGSFLLYGSDVGGLWRSRDGGRTWETCNVGYHARGTAGMAIDPGAPQRCLAIGANSAPSPFHGIYLSTDGAASWRLVLPAKPEIAGSHDMRDQLAYDRSSWDAAAKRTRTVYWSRIADDKPGWGKVEPRPGIWRSDDGGETWAELADTAAAAGGTIAVDADGTVWCANTGGLWRSRSRGAEFTKVRDGACQHLALCPTRPGHLWLVTAEAILASRDGGTSFTPLPLAGLAGDGPLRRVAVSPADPKRLALWRQGDDWRWRWFVSHDGGATVRPARVDAGAFLPANARQHLAVWHPGDARIAWSTGGDFPTRSDDGGVVFRPSSDGYSCLLVGGRFAFSPHDPDVLFIGSQDYNGAITTDAGRTWTYCNPAGQSWGGYTYGGHAIDRDLVVVGVADGWGGKRILRVSSDGGRSWRDTGLDYAGADCAFGDPRDRAVAFAGSLRSADRGATWRRMEGCRGVYAAGPDGALYGARWDRTAKRGAVVVSRDHGASWDDHAPLDAPLEDLAVGPDGTLWAVVGKASLRRWQEGAWVTVTGLPSDQRPDWQQVDSVAVDPVDPRLVYASRCRNVFMSDAAVMRSRDGGATWENLTLRQPLREGRVDGGREAFCIRVHPRTRELWIAGNCYGLWAYPPPP